MTKINIISGFLGAGKTTLIKKLLGGAFGSEKVVLLENEYGEVGVDSGFMRDSGIQITELNSGCICCTLVGDFSRALDELIDTYHPDRIIIEPSGVGKLSDIRRVVVDMMDSHEITLEGSATVADVGKCRMYAKNFGEFFIDQIENAETIILSRTQNTTEERIEKCVNLLREYNEHARIITTPWDELTSQQMLDVIESAESLLSTDEVVRHAHEHEHHHDHDECCDHDHEHHHDHDECCDHDHEHHHDHDECCDHDHEHHHDHDECCDHDHEHHHDHDECCDHDHEHHHDHDECDHDHEHECCDHDHDHEHHHDHDHGDGCTCGCHHDHHGHHHADEVFQNIGVETPRKFEEAAIRAALDELDDEKRFGSILRAKGILPLTDGKWLHFDYVPGESDVRYGSADYTGRLCVIGTKINEAALKELFGL
ncbi:MAG: CobW family GTP-binding protein [Aristaeellaceae bacterium]